MTKQIANPIEGGFRQDVLAGRCDKFGMQRFIIEDFHQGWVGSWPESFKNPGMAPSLSTARRVENESSDCSRNLLIVPRSCRINVTTDLPMRLFKFSPKFRFLYVIMETKFATSSQRLDEAASDDDQQHNS